MFHSQINQQIALKTIRKLHFSVNAVWNGQEALDYLAQEPSPTHPRPDIILMDVQVNPSLLHHARLKRSRLTLSLPRQAIGPERAPLADLARLTPSKGLVSMRYPCRLFAWSAC